MSSQVSFDSRRVQKGSIQSETKSQNERPCIKLKQNILIGSIPNSIIRGLEDYGSHTVDLKRPYWKSLNLTIYCKLLQEWRTTKIQANNNECPILKDIKNINFPCLVWINLSANNFMSIEIICRIYMPKLENIKLSGNCLISFKSLRKCYWPRITEISFSRNSIQDWSHLSELYIKGNSLNLEYFENPDVSDFLPFIKMQGRKVPSPQVFDSSFVTEKKEDVFTRRNIYRR